ncbi:bifunctional diaminohydroxyphosphoribosylaminopyrimidine deaminase/5-amino-6-(5-phosphoribosylamino)uracil reductase RibD [Ligilactobacillus sp. WILCCON 0076]|uniref:Riboflavin biosynthesis protein RibD n=1 Tax=Ligilactobacillus ubinensis TaxID=2876789 RepID=A0A9X2FIY4_9LACO|nr:bifunctional diaminohydroxyphosphoribosylaminopyrimidine deaminase/5-amino-6-(5-phosphoribosylamino)uracil reductase RibD [Ligilactobacillus ubinensis]MCP0886607.1 bifunctional diaminohydroxyphosphoribosylaminopyrimidine deaminase/5-amino-6-(5-phosphoribosylamino)uracil reductase RibD [Ligilactobacillus ubinensis]
MEDLQFLNLAIMEAQKARDSTWTNPLVGAVIVKNHKVLATGYHHKFGQVHAEIDALNNLADIHDARNATIYITLEPCSHYGKTPPCANRLITVGIKRVVIGQKDPNPLVAGKGITLLENAGVSVDLIGHTEYLNMKYNFFFKNKRPFITLKYAMTLDGKINQYKSSRSIISNYTSYLDTQNLRADNQAILIGETTLIADNPQLNVRTKTMEFPPIKIILVNSADSLDSSLNIFQGTEPVWILSRRISKKHWPKNIQVYSNSHWSVKDIINFLNKKEIQSLLVEGGSSIHAKFVSANLVDELVIYIAPKIFGGSSLPAIYGVTNSNNFDMTIKDISQLDGDIRIIARRTN